MKAKKLCTVALVSWLNLNMLFLARGTHEPIQFRATAQNREPRGILLFHNMQLLQWSYVTYSLR
jgi:hypothetical protein